MAFARFIKNRNHASKTICIPGSKVFLRICTTFALATFYMLVSGTLAAQVSLVNSNSSRTDSAFLFIGVENKLYLEGVSDANDLVINARYTIIKKTGSDSRYVALPTVPGTDTIQVFKNGREVLSKCFYIKMLPYMQMAVGTYTDRLLTTSQILATQLLRVSVKDFSGIINHTVSSFSVRFISRKYEAASQKIVVNGNMITSELRDVIRNLLPDDKILFENIKTTDNSSYTRKLDDVTIVIK